MKFGFIKKVSQVVSGNILYQVILIATLPYITRQYSGESYGMYASLFAIGSMLAIMATLRLEMAIVPSKDDIESQELVLASIISSFVVCLIASMIGLSITEVFTTFFLSKIQIIWAALFSFCSAMVAIATQLAIKEERFVTLSISKVIGVIGLVASQILFFKFNTTWASLFAGAFIGISFQLTTLIITRKKIIGPKRKWNSSTFYSIWKNIKKNYTYPLYNYPSAIFNSGAYQLPVILITSIYGPLIGANFSVVQKTLNGPTSLIGNAISNVVYPFASKMINGGQKFGVFLRRSNYYAVVVAILIAGVSTYTLPTVYNYIFGSEYTESGSMANVLILYFLIRFIVNSQTTILLALKKLRPDLLFMILLFLTQITPLVIGQLLNLSFKVVLWTMSISGSLLYLIMLGYIYREVKIHEKGTRFTSSSIIKEIQENTQA